MDLDEEDRFVLYLNAEDIKCREGLIFIKNISTLMDTNSSDYIKNLTESGLKDIIDKDTMDKIVTSINIKRINDNKLEKQTRELSKNAGINLIDTEPLDISELKNILK